MLGWIALAVYVSKRRSGTVVGDFVCVDCGQQYVDCEFEVYKGKLMDCPECGGYLESEN